MRVPEGRGENSPAIHRWEKKIAPPVPEGRLSINKIKVISRPYRDYGEFLTIPGDQSLGYSRMSLWDGFGIPFS